MSDTQDEMVVVEEPTNSQEDGKNHWDSVAKDFQNLGQSIAGVVKSIWQNEDNKKQLDELRTGLEKMADQVTSAVDEAIKSPTATEVKTEVKKAVHEVKEMSGKVYTDSKPHLVTALKKLDGSIQKLIEGLEAKQATDSKEDATEGESTSEEA